MNEEREPLRNDVDLSVVIPVFRSEAILPRLIDRLRLVLDGMARSYEIILIDDGSPDKSWYFICELCRGDSRHIVAVQLMRNYGQHNALMCGFRYARGRLVVTMDDDLQHLPESIPDLLNTLEVRDLDLVYGHFEKRRHEGWRVLGSALVNRFFRLTFGTTVTSTSFRVIRRELLQSILSYDLSHTYVDGLLAWNTRRIGEVVVPHNARHSGRSGYSTWKLVSLAFNLVTNFSLLPLHLVSVCGVLVAGGGLALGAYFLVQSLRMQISVPGYASTIIAVLVLGGIQLLSLGIMGEYLGRLHMNVNRMPQYVVRQVHSPIPVTHQIITGVMHGEEGADVEQSGPECAR